MREGTIYLVLMFPTPWPIQRDVVLLSKSEGNFELHIFAYSDGHLSFLLKENDKILIEKHFQKISIGKVNRAIMTLLWKDNDARIILNEDELLPFSNDNNVLILKGKEISENQQDLINLPNPDKLNDNLERFFIETIIDIIQKLNNGRRYDIIKASGLLRQLLLDKEPLVYIINRKFKVKLEFEVIEYRDKLPIDDGRTELHAKFLNPNFPGAKTVKTSLKEFLSINCLEYKSTTITIKEIIKYCSHVKGGIHTGKPEDDIDITLISLDKMIKILEEESSIVLLTGIIQIVLNGLKPLIKEISKSAI